MAALQQQLTAEGVNPVARSAINVEDAAAREKRLRQTQENIHYDNAIWLGTSVPKGLSSRRTSLITDLRNGRIPPLTERCIVWTDEGPPMLPPAYNDIHQIFQTPDYVVVFTELAAAPGGSC